MTCVLKNIATVVKNCDYKTEKQEFIIKFPLLLISAKIWEKLHRITNELVIFKSGIMEIRCRENVGQHKLINRILS